MSTWGGCNKCIDWDGPLYLDTRSWFGATYIAMLASSDEYHRISKECPGCAKIYAVQVGKLVKLLYRFDIVKGIQYVSPRARRK